MGRFRIYQRSGTSFSSRLHVAVLLLIAIEAAGLYTFGKQVTIARVDPSLITDAGRLRLLVMETDALAHHFQYGSADSIRTGIQNELEARSDEMRAIRAGLTEGLYNDDARAFLEDPPTRVGQRLDDFAGAARRIAHMSEGDDAMLREAVSAISSETEGLQGDIDALSQLIEEDYRAALQRSQIVYLGGGALTFVLLLGLGLFVFMPMERRLRDDFRQFKDRERRFRLLVENAYDLISVLDTDGTFAYASPSVRRITGYEPSEFRRKSALDIIHHDDVEFVTKKLMTLVNLPLGSVVDVDFRIVTKDGSERHVEAIGKNLLDDPDVRGIVVNSRDITDRKEVELELRRYQDELEERVRARTSQIEATNCDLKDEIDRRNRAEAKLLERERHFRKVIMGASDPIFIMELGDSGMYGTYSDVNEAACNHLGYSKDELLDLSPKDIVVGYDALQAEDFDWIAKERTLVIEMNLIAKDGRRRPYECRLDALMIGERTVVICLARDISERVALEQAMREQNRTLELRVAERAAQLEKRTVELETANEELEAFAYSVSHDLRAPIRSLVGFSELAIERMNGSADDTVKHYISRVQANAVKMGALVDDLLAYSRIGRASPRRTDVDPRPLIEEIVRDQISTDERPPEITIGELPRAKADPTLLRQIYQNLLSNAVKFTKDEESPEIVVGATCKDGNVVYFVKDNGVGFDMKHAEKLFGVFQRLHSSDKYEGTGAGLAIVDRIVQKHGGRIWAESKPNEGATFYFTLDDHAA